MKNKKSTKNKIIWILIIILTVFIVFTSVRIGLNLADQVEKNDQTSNKQSLNKKEETNDFIINYTEESYKIENDDKNEVVINRRTIPTLTSGKYPIAANKIGSYLKQVSEVKWNEMKSAADSYDKTNNNKDMGVDIVINNIVQTDLYFTFKLIITGTIGETEWNEELVYSFNTKTGDILTLKDISSDEIGLKQAIYNNLYKTISSQSYSKELDLDWNKRLVKELNTEGNWCLTDEGISYSFPKYSFGPGHIGIIKYTLKYSDINNFLSNEFKKNA